MSITSTIEDNKKRVTELKSVLTAKGAEIKGMSDSWKDETGNGHLVLTTEQHRNYVKTVQEAKEIRDTIAAMESANGVFEFLDAPESQSEAGRDAADAQRARGQAKSLSSEFFNSEMLAEIKQGGYRRGGSFDIEAAVPDMSLAAAKDVYSAMGGNISIPALGSAQSLGFTERQLRPGRVRDLFPVERTNAALLYWVRETGFTNRASVVPERTAADGSAATGGPTDIYGLKPKSEITITTETSPISTIAHIMYVHKHTLDDEPQMRGLLDRDLIDGVKMAEDEQILWGDGVGDNMTGLMNTPGIQAYNGLATDKRSAQIRRAATRAILAYFQPTGVVLHPFDWEHIELETDKNGAYTVAVSVAVGGEKRVWRLQVVDSPAMHQGDALVANFGTACKLYDRQQVTVELSTENRDLWERNTYTLRGEERLGLVCGRPEALVHLSLTEPDDA